MLDVFFYEAFEEEAALLKQKLPRGIEAGFTSATVQEYQVKDPPASIISIRTQSRIPAEWAASLRAILTRSTGYEHLADYRTATGGTLPCGYLPTYCARAVAEQAALLWMALLRRLPAQIHQMESFHRDGLTGKETAGRCLAVYGVGNIGHEIAAIGRGLGMEVLGIDLVERHSDIRYADPLEGLRRADIIACAMNLNETNHAYFSYDRLRLSRPDSIFVNVARGEMSPSGDLLRLVREKRLGGVGLDVFNCESELAVALRSGQTGAHPEITALLQLKTLPNVIVTPHNAFNTTEAIERKAEQSISEMVKFAGTGAFSWPVP